VTVCADFKRCIFGEVEQGCVRQSALGRLAGETWAATPAHFPRVCLHGFVVMPNHFHAILELNAAPSPREVAPANYAGPVARFVGADSVSAVVRSFKAEVTRRARFELGWEGNVWQSGYFDRVIRDGQEFSDATRYIEENPMKWEWDVENVAKHKETEGNPGLAQHAAPLQRRGSR
jgi:REP element-mobilizing transposase RayT